MHDGVIAISICPIWAPPAILDLNGCEFSLFDSLRERILQRLIKVQHNLAKRGELLMDWDIFPVRFPGAPYRQSSPEGHGPNCTNFG